VSTDDTTDGDEATKPGEVVGPTLGVTPGDAEDSPINPEVIRAAHKEIAGLWKRIEKRAPEAVKTRVMDVLALADEVFGNEQPPVWKKNELAKALVELQSELRGRKPWEATFYRDGRLAIVRAQDPITIRGAVDHARIERFYERYVKQAEAAYERMQYFLDRVGALAPDEKKVERKPWEQPYIALDTYREMLWGKVAKRDPHVRRE
jgi:hypothetical protein